MEFFRLTSAIRLVPELREAGTVESNWKKINIFQQTHISSIIMIDFQFRALPPGALRAMPDALITGFCHQKSHLPANILR